MNPLDDKLFREEVLHSRCGRIEGEIVLTQPVRTHALVLLVFGLVAALAVWLTLGTYTRTETARGILVTESASAKIVALRAGQVVELSVQEGDYVRAGQRLAAIRTEQADESGASAVGQGLTALDSQRQLAQQRASSERARFAATLSGIRQQRADIAGQMALQNEAVASARDMFERVEGLLSSGFISRIEVERRRQAYIAVRQQLAQLQQQRNLLSAEESRAIAELSRIDVDAGTEIESLLQQRARLRSERAYTLIAPISGRVTAVQAAAGRTVEPTVPLMEIVPDRSALRAQVYVPSRAIGFVRMGQEVRLLYDAFPYQRFGSFKGRIVAISRTVIDPRQLAAPLAVEEPVYRIDVAAGAQSVDAYGERQPLQPGMTLTASLVLDRRSFLDWLLTPLNAVIRRNGQE